LNQRWLGIESTLVGLYTSTQPILNGCCAKTLIVNRNEQRDASSPRRRGGLFYIVRELTPLRPSFIFGAMTKPLILVFFAACAFGELHAQTNIWQPAPGHTQVAIRPGKIPDARPVPGPEYVTNKATATGERWVCADNVSQPTMTVYSPKGTNTGAAVVVFPGGGYMCLAMDIEGTEICDWLTSRGLTAVVTPLPRCSFCNMDTHGSRFSKRWGTLCRDRAVLA
jgi:hypothetical protein